MLPKSLLACFFLSAMVQSVPMVAFGVFMNEEIKMPLDEQSRFYATIFLPWSLKPIFSHIMDSYALFGFKRRSYIALANLVVGLSMMMTAMFVETVGQMYVSSLLRSGFEALAECGLGLVLIDTVGDSRQASDGATDVAQIAQSRSTAARMFGSLISFMVGLLIYGCGSSVVATNVTSRSIIGSTSIICCCAAVMACFLPEPESTAHRKEQLASVIMAWNFKNRILVLLGVLSFQFCFVWIGVQSLIPVIPWVSVLVISTFGIVTFSIVAVIRANIPWAPVASAALLFLMNSTPGYDSPWFSFKLFALKGSKCSMQALLVLGEVSSLAACSVYPRLTSWYLTSKKDANIKLRAEHALIFFTVVASIVELLDVLLALDWRSFSFMDDTSALIRFALVGVLVSFFGQLAFISKQVFATEHSYDNQQVNALFTPGVLYGIYLSLIDFGDSASGWISAPLTAGLHLSYSSQTYDLLWALVVISTAAQLLVVLIIPRALNKLGGAISSQQQKQHNDEAYDAVIQNDQPLIMQLSRTNLSMSSEATPSTSALVAPAEAGDELVIA